LISKLSAELPYAQFAMLLYFLIPFYLILVSGNAAKAWFFVNGPRPLASQRDPFGKSRTVIFYLKAARKRQTGTRKKEDKYPAQKNSRPSPLI